MQVGVGRAKAVSYGIAALAAHPLLPGLVAWSATRTNNERTHPYDNTHRDTDCNYTLLFAYMQTHVGVSRIY